MGHQVKKGPAYFRVKAHSRNRNCLINGSTRMVEASSGYNPNEDTEQAKTSCAPS